MAALSKNPFSTTSTNSTNSNSIAGAIIAGGQNTRMGGNNKSLLQLGGKSFLEHVYFALNGPCDIILLNTNSPLNPPQTLHVQEVTDLNTNHLGPLNGIIACLSWLKQHSPSCEWLLTSPSDTPFLPQDYALKFREGLNTTEAQMTFAVYQGRKHYLNALWHISVLETLNSCLSQGQRSLKGLLSTLSYASLDFSDYPYDPFFNVNTPEELAAAEEQYRQLKL